MKMQNKSFKDFLNDAAEISIEESYANYGGTNSLGSVQSSSRNKYTPATVLKAPPLRLRNPDITMGQDPSQTKAPPNMIYPFESIFTELVDIYVKLEALQSTMDGAKSLSTLTDAKKENVSEAVNELVHLQTRLRRIIGKIEEITI